MTKVKKLCGNSGRELRAGGVARPEGVRLGRRGPNRGQGCVCLPVVHSPGGPSKTLGGGGWGTSKPWGLEVELGCSHLSTRGKQPWPVASCFGSPDVFLRVLEDPGFSREDPPIRLTSIVIFSICSGNIEASKRRPLLFENYHPPLHPGGLPFNSKSPPPPASRHTGHRQIWGTRGCSP